MAANKLLDRARLEAALKIAHDLGLEYELRCAKNGLVVAYLLTKSELGVYIELHRRLKNVDMAEHEERFVDEPLGTSAEEPIGEVTVMIPTTAFE